MRNVLVRDLPDDVHAALQRKAEHRNQSLQQPLIQNRNLKTGQNSENIYQPKHGMAIQGIPATSNVMLVALLRYVCRDTPAYVVEFEETNGFSYSFSPE